MTTFGKSPDLINKNVTHFITLGYLIRKKSSLIQSDFIAFLSILLFAHERLF